MLTGVWERESTMGRYLGKLFFYRGVRSTQRMNRHTLVRISKNEGYTSE
jgi:hypothetical protein